MGIFLDIRSGKGNEIVKQNNLEAEKIQMKDRL